MFSKLILTKYAIKTNRFFIIKYGDFIMIINNADILNKMNIEISAAEYVVLNENWKCGPFSSPFSRLYFVTEGEGRLKCGDKIITMHRGNVYFVPAECEFSYSCEYLEKLYFHVSISTIEGYDLFSRTNGIYSIPYSIEDILKLHKYLLSDNYEDIFKLKMLILKTMIDITDTYKFNKTYIKQLSPLIQRVISHIEKNTRINLSVADIKNELFLSESKIRNSFKEEMGIPIGRYIDDMVFIKAKQLLSKKNLSIAQISSELGFCDQFYFSRRFKERFNMTPSEFKNNGLS